MLYSVCELQSGWALVTCCSLECLVRCFLLVRRRHQRVMYVVSKRDLKRITAMNTIYWELTYYYLRNLLKYDAKIKNNKLHNQEFEFYFCYNTTCKSRVSVSCKQGD